ncbi:MAG TPA: hypothetical protein VFS95_02230 [Telluria sp.]|nr:hypothetical protein [Telluria sp.]
MSNPRTGTTDYFMALNRLISNKPRVVPKGTIISNDAVSLEAGRQIGSIKSSRSKQFSLLIKAIKDAREAQKVAQPSLKKQSRNNKEALQDVREKLDAALGREISLLYEVFRLKELVAKLTGENIFPIRP